MFLTKSGKGVVAVPVSGARKPSPHGYNRLRGSAGHNFHLAESNQESPGRGASPRKEPWGFNKKDQGGKDGKEVGFVEEWNPPSQPKEMQVRKKEKRRKEGRMTREKICERKRERE